MNNNCPVCNKGGLPDFKIQQTICPQCNSDLTPYYLLTLVNRPKKNRTRNIVFAGFSLILLFMTLQYFSLRNEKNKIAMEKMETERVFLDSIQSLKVLAAKLPEMKNISSSQLEEISITYTVKKGDNLSKIARIFYNDRGMYKKIGVDNKLDNSYFLQVGQRLTIKLKP